VSAQAETEAEAEVKTEEESEEETKKEPETESAVEENTESATADPVKEEDEQPQNQGEIDELLEGSDQGESVKDGDTSEAEGSDEEDDPWAEALAEQLEEESADSENPTTDTVSDDYAPAILNPLESDAVNSNNRELDLDLILDIPVTIAMEIGRTKINVRNLLQLNQGSVVELDRLAGEPLDVMVNGMLIAQGEVVVVNEKFGIRLTDVVSPQERLKNLKK